MLRSGCEGEARNSVTPKQTKSIQLLLLSIAAIWLDLCTLTFWTQWSFHWIHIKLFVFAAGSTATKWGFSCWKRTPLDSISMAPTIQHPKFKGTHGLEPTRITLSVDRKLQQMSTALDKHPAKARISCRVSRFVLVSCRCCLALY